jgi:hypothetical protein
MKTGLLLLTVFITSAALAQNRGKIRPKKPNNFSWGATYGNGPQNVSSKKIDSLNPVKSPASQRTRKSKSGVKLDDLKNPFDTSKVKMEPHKPLQGNGSTNQRQKPRKGQLSNSGSQNQVKPRQNDTSRVVYRWEPEGIIRN